MTVSFVLFILIKKALVAANTSDTLSKLILVSTSEKKLE
jgi:hypothetical protein